MTALAKLLDQRCQGQVQLSFGVGGVDVLRESGSAKVRVPRGGHEAILINTSGGLAGGDRVSLALEAHKGAQLCVTTQAAERVYRTLGPPADVRVALKANEGATLYWLPQETIFFEDSALSRQIDIELEQGSSFLGVESMVFGRQEMGEIVSRVAVKDRWRVQHSGSLFHVEAFKMGPAWPQSTATFAEHRAAATLLMIAPQIEERLDRVRNLIAVCDGASAWNGKLVARLLATDGYELRKKLVSLMHALIGVGQLPRCWTF